MRRTLSILACLFLCAVPASAEPWTIDDLILSESVSDFQFSPDGRWAVWVHSVPDKARDEEIANLLRMEVATGKETVLTRGTESCLHPRWSPDGKHLAFLSARSSPQSRTEEKGRKRTKSSAEGDDKSQLWLLDPFGGEPWPVTECSRGVLHYDWAGPDALVFVAQEEPTLRASKLKAKKDDATVVEDDRHEPQARLFRVEVATKKVTRLTTNSDQVGKLAVSPDGRWAVAIHNRSLRYTYDNKVKPTVVLHDLKNSESRLLFREPDWNIQHIRWALDSKGFYATNWVNSQPQLAQAGIPFLHYFDLAADKAGTVDLAWERGLAQEAEDEGVPGFVVTGDGFLALLADGVHYKVARYTRTVDGWRREWVTGEHAGNLFACQVSADGRRLLYSYSTASTPARWYCARLAGASIEKPRRIAAINKDLANRQCARTEVVHWKGARDEEVEGILYYPHGYKNGTRYPLVVMIHGGPAGADFDAWEDWWMYPANLVCQRGAFVLKLNYHGSTQYGLKWLEAITRGKYGELETIDIEKGVDHLIARGLVDGERLALCGWSNGAILANRLTVQTTRYRAAVAGAGNVEYVSDWASCEFGDAFDRYYFGKSPLEDPQDYIRRSPFYRLDKVRTPTLILFGSEDRTVATQQGWMQYRALQQLGRTDVRFVLFPGEKHVFTKLSHQRRKVQEELAWLDRYLFHKPDKVQESLKTASPLAWLLKRRQASREGERFGVLVNKQLIPETVRHGKLKVGRFEVTRAQYAEFDRKYAVGPGRANYPAAGIPFEQAKDYCAWLSKSTGRRYRLPTADEAEELYSESKENENTLDRWAGYAVNPDDMIRLREHLKELDGEASLLQEVGSFRAVGDAGLFDLGGNVAEWVTTKDGKGVLRGGSADAPADAKQKRNQAGPAYRGLRVIETRTME
jgi:dipeptidyl aminopeptidase/acylaminoacyl peptidase